MTHSKSKGWEKELTEMVIIPDGGGGCGWADGKTRLSDLSLAKIIPLIQSQKDKSFKEGRASVLEEIEKGLPKEIESQVSGNTNAYIRNLTLHQIKALLKAKGGK